MNDLMLIRKNLFRRKLRAGLMIVSILVAFAIFTLGSLLLTFMLPALVLATDGGGIAAGLPRNTASGTPTVRSCAVFVHDQ